LSIKIKDWMYELPQGEYCTIHSSSNVVPSDPSLGFPFDPIGTESPSTTNPSDVLPDADEDVIP